MRTIILTGSTGGLGSVLARKILEKHCGKLICVYRNEEKFQTIFSNCKKEFYSYKTTSNDNYERMENAIIDCEPKEVVLVLNAFSIVPIKLIGEYTVCEIEQMICGNIKQNVVLINRIIQICRKNGYALKIINLDSGAADFPLTGWGNYCAAKAYINAFLAVLSLENADYRIVSFDPGIMDTNMQRQIREVDKRIFNQVDQFIAYKNNEQLVSPSIVAEQLIDRYIFDWKACQAREKFKQ